MSFHQQSFQQQSFQQQSFNTASSYRMITTNSDLARLCQAAGQGRALALDTEFVRVRSYYPKLGLIQLACEGQIALIDPLRITDWSAFVALLRDEAVTKFFHAGSEDLEVLQHDFDTLPSPFLDTQVLAAFTGHPLSVGLATLVEQYAGVRLDKSEGRTDWLARPLTVRQCEYASADVRYLLPLAGELTRQAQALGWMDAAASECALMLARRTEAVSPQDAWRDIGGHERLHGQQLACLQSLAAWRVQEAQRRDLALNFVLRGETLWQIARHLPTRVSDLAALGLHGKEIRLYSKSVLAQVAQARALPQEALPASVVNPLRMAGFSEALGQIKSLMEQLALKTGLQVGLLASRRQMMQLLRWHWQIPPLAPPELLNGWRGELLAQPLAEILARYPLSE